MGFLRIVTLYSGICRSGNFEYCIFIWFEPFLSLPCVITYYNSHYIPSEGTMPMCFKSSTYLIEGHTNPLGFICFSRGSVQVPVFLRATIARGSGPPPPLSGIAHALLAFFFKCLHNSMCNSLRSFIFSLLIIKKWGSSHIFDLKLFSCEFFSKVTPS